jgi:2-C-methyl-D-erythritol 2,4-cyclodiphosphate synthase/2-C-methyl-D-erythritol 4-phosphate cytidylyltransferase
MAMSLEALIKGGVDKIVIVTNEATQPHATQLAARAGVPVTLCDGGVTRQDSVYKGLKKTGKGIVVIHDAARCLARPSLVQACIDSARLYNSGVAAIPIRDTVLHVTKGGEKVAPMPRDEMLRMQTPQAFDYLQIFAAYERARKTGLPATDDSSLYAASGHAVRFVRGHANNRKLTTPDDLVWLEEHLFSSSAGLGAQSGLRVGYGEDVHRLIPGRSLILSGVKVPFDKGLLGHSDADVVTHALIDALLGAAGLGDIGQQFPDNDERYRDISSLKLLGQVTGEIAAAGYGVRNADIVITAEQPKLVQYFPEMREMLCSALHLQREYVSVKATTTEGMGPEGRGECIRATAVVLLFTLK